MQTTIIIKVMTTTDLIFITHMLQLWWLVCCYNAISLNMYIESILPVWDVAGVVKIKYR